MTETPTGISGLSGVRSKGAILISTYALKISCRQARVKRAEEPREDSERSRPAEGGQGGGGADRTSPLPDLLKPVRVRGVSERPERNKYVFERMSRVTSERRLVWRQSLSSGLAWFVHHRLGIQCDATPKKEESITKKREYQKMVWCLI